MSISSPPCSTNPEEGIALVHSSLRSIVMSRASFTLFLGFNPTSTTAADNLQIAGLPETTPDFINNATTRSPDPRSLLKSCIDETDAGAETKVTSLLAQKLNAVGNKEERCFTAKKEKTLSNEEVARKGRTDITISKETESNTDPKETKKVPLGLVEVGLLHKGEAEGEAEVINSKLERRFWEKAGQALKYLHFLRSDSKWKWKEALLLGVLVATHDWNKGRLAVFVCEPKGNDGWRMALLWRAQLESRDQLSAAFGYYVNGLTYLSKEGAKLARDDNIVWEYLGPNCAKVAVKDTNEVWMIMGTSLADDFHVF
jgi:hypothetical protein